MTLLRIENLRVEFGSLSQPFPAVDGVDMEVESGELLGIVGESGSGKSVAMLALMGLVDAPGRVTADLVQFDGHDLLRLSARARRAIVGKDIAMIFQDAQSSLNPSYTVGFQIKETLRVHMGLRGAALERRALELLDMVEIPDPQARLNAYPHQLSGGMSQRVMIAMAISCGPKLLIADEPTTALDVTIQSQIMDLLVKLQREQNMALIMITHDLAVIAEIAQRIAVMYAGQVVETSASEALFAAPRHPYTQALLASIPEHSKGARRLKALSGMVPGQYDRPIGCLLSPRCPYAQQACSAQRPAMHEGVRCITPLNASGVPHV
jgi:dipeptide transport system ATP-binding protein